MISKTKEKRTEFIQLDTGEILTAEEIVREHLQEETEKRTNQVKGLNKRKSKEEVYQYLDFRYGSFSFNSYKRVIELFTSQDKFDGATCFKFMYLVTFMDYDNKLRYGCKYGDKHREFMTLKDLPEVLRITGKQARIVKDKLIALGAITIDNNDNITINPDLVSKGKLNKGYKQNSARVFEETVRELYERSTAREHARLAIFIQLLPYINIYHNSICSNPEEKDARFIEPMSMPDICRVLGLNVEKASRTENELFKISVAGEYMIGKFLRYGKYSYCINPRLYYKGSNIEDLKALGNLFLIGTEVK
ncbi:hypothetical protein [Clostridium tertium]|uniref:hypothetical protein n=1 Tax=Clostridium tertium TaxID=1559 RepID=UPI000BE47988|nr:hypothetical protein [Clostridium tertium]